MICSECGWKHPDDRDWSKPVMGRCEKCGEIRPVFGPKKKEKDDDGR